jgi:hypothetical protein
MAEYISSERAERTKAFEFLLSGQFADITDGREAIVQRMGETGAGLSEVLENFFLPNVKEGLITTPRGYDDDSEKTPLLPVLLSDMNLRVKPRSLLLSPTPSQLAAAGLPNRSFQDDAFYQEVTTRFNSSLSHATRWLGHPFGDYGTTYHTRACLMASNSRYYTVIHTRPMTCINMWKLRRSDNPNQATDTVFHEARHVWRSLHYPTEWELLGQSEDATLEEIEAIITGWSSAAAFASLTDTQGPPDGSDILPLLICRLVDKFSDGKSLQPDAINSSNVARFHEWLDGELANYSTDHRRMVLSALRK